MVKLRVSNHKFMIETGRYESSRQTITPSLWFQRNWTWNSLSLLVPKIFKSFFAQIKSHLHNFQQLSYSDLVIKLMKSEDIYLNLQLTNYISLLNNLRDIVLSCKNNVTWLSVILLSYLLLFLFLSYLMYVTFAVL